MPEAAMGNARFFSRSGPHSLAVVAQAASGLACSRDLLLEGVAPLQIAGRTRSVFSITRITLLPLNRLWPAQ